MWRQRGGQWGRLSKDGGLGDTEATGPIRSSVRAVVDMKPGEGSEENRRKTAHKVQSLFQGALL